MNTQIGLWIDHRQAFVVHLTEGETTTENIESNIRKHVKVSGGSKPPSPYSPQHPVAQDKVDRKYQHHLEQYYQQVSDAIDGAELIYIMGPGMAKTELRKYLEKTKRKPQSVIELETADNMTEAQIIAKVRDHYG